MLKGRPTPTPTPTFMWMQYQNMLLNVVSFFFSFFFQFFYFTKRIKNLWNKNSMNGFSYKKDIVHPRIFGFKHFCVCKVYVHCPIIKKI